MQKFKNLFFSNIIFFIYLFTILFLELSLKIFLGIDVFNIGIFYTILFTLSIASILTMIYNLLPQKFDLIMFYTSLGLISFLFASQLVYFNIFKTFYIAYSAGNAGKVLEFATEALFGIKKSIHFLVPIFTPLILLLFYRKKLRPYTLSKKSKLYMLIALGLSAHLLALVFINLGGKETNSPYNLYYNIHQPEFSVENLGMITYFRLDAKRQIFKWKPKIDQEELVVAIIEKQEEKEEEIEVVEEKIPEYNTLEIDFEKLIQNETDKEILAMHQYFNAINPSKKNEYTELFKDHNLIFITAEGFSHLAVKEDLTPTLYKMVNKGFYFENFYTSIWGVSTSDGEYVATTSLLPKPGVWSYSLSKDNYMPFAMGNQLRQLGYLTKAYHNHSYDYYDRDSTHPNMGYDFKGIGNGLVMSNSWPRSDLEMMEVTIPDYIDEDRFHVYYMTVSGHLRYTFEGNAMAFKNRDKVDHLNYSSNVKAYLATQIELDLALEYLEKMLLENNKAHNTFIVLSTDHYPYGLDKKYIDELNGSEVEDNFQLYKNNLIIYKPGMDRIVVEKPASSLDIIPTISNLMGLPFDSRLLMGRDILSDEDPLVILSNRSFISKYGKYDSRKNEFIPDSPMDIDKETLQNHIDSVTKIIDGKFYFSQKILEKDYYKEVLGP